MEHKLSFDQLPNDDKQGEFKLPPEGKYNLKITKGSVEIASTGSTMLKLEHDIEGSTQKVWDNLVLFNKDGQPITIGQLKLRRILEATNTIIDGEFTLGTAIKLLTGKSYNAQLNHEEYNDKVNLRLGHPNTYSAVTNKVVDRPAQLPNLKDQETLAVNNDIIQGVIEDDEDI